MSYDPNREERHFVVSGEPKGKGRPRATVRGKHAAMYTPADTAMYENHVAQCYLAKHQGKPPFKGAVHVEVQAYFKYPKAAHWPVNARHNGEIRDEWREREHLSKPDADNVLKAILDGMSKANAWLDDTQVTCAIVFKCYSEEPCVRVFVYGEASNE